jgi:hypothetical protein
MLTGRCHKTRKRCCSSSQRDLSKHRQRSKAQEGTRAHDLVMIQAQLFLAILEENLDLPTRRSRSAVTSGCISASTSASANWLRPRLRTMELLRETDSAHSNWETGLPHATLREAGVFHRIPSAPAVRERQY